MVSNKSGNQQVSERVRTWRFLFTFWKWEQLWYCNYDYQSSSRLHEPAIVIWGLKPRVCDELAHSNPVCLTTSSRRKCMASNRFSCRTIPTTFFPGLPQISPLMKNIGGGGGTPTTTQRPTSTSNSGGATQTQWGQCGGEGWT